MQKNVTCRAQVFPSSPVYIILFEIPSRRASIRAYTESTFESFPLSASLRSQNNEKFKKRIYATYVDCESIPRRGHMSICEDGVAALTAPCATHMQ